MNKETVEQAAREFAGENFPNKSSWEFHSQYSSFIAGAEWQSTQQPQESAGVVVKAIDLLTNASPYIEEKLNKHTIDLICKQIDGYIATILPAQPINSGWQTEKPVFTEDCILLTKSGDEYHSWLIIKTDYWQWCNMDGEEYGDIADLAADKYKVIKLLKQNK